MLNNEKFDWKNSRIVNSDIEYPFQYCQEENIEQIHMFRCAVMTEIVLFMRQDW